MLPKKNRVPADHFPRLLKQGSVFHSTYFTLRSMTGGKRENRFSVVVPKKVASLAVKRNALRRKVYAFLEKEIHTVLVPHSSLLYLKTDISSLPASRMREEIHDLLRKAKLIA